MLVGLVIVALAIAAVLGGMIAFGTGKAPPPMNSLGEPLSHVDFSQLPKAQFLAARDGTKLAYRFYPGPSTVKTECVVILIHGATASSPSMHALAMALAAQGMSVYSLDMRGHGDSGRRGDIDYPGQLDDDLSEVVSFVKSRHPSTPVTLVGFSAGGGFALHAAATPLGRAFDRIVLLAPMLGVDAPMTKQEGSNALVKPFVPRIIAIALLNRLGIHAFDHLQVLAFGNFHRPELTPNYSFLLMRGFATTDYADDVRRAQAPLAVVVGTNDEFFTTSAYAPALNALRPGIPVAVMPGLTHIGLIVDPSAVPVIIAAIHGQI